MTRLRSRIGKLEMTLSRPRWTDTFATVQQAALSKLLVADRAIFQLGIAGGCGDPIDFDAPAWARWESAFANALVETKCPFSISAMDMLL